MRWVSGVAERALFVREETDNQYSRYLSQWGGSDQTVAAVCEGRHPLELPSVAWHAVDPATFGDIVESTDYLGTEALYRARDGETTVFLALWFGLPLPDERASRSAGALVAVRSLSDARTLRSQFREFKGALVDGLQAGTIPPYATPLMLRAAIASLAGRERYLSIGRSGAGNLSGMGGPDTP